MDDGALCTLDELTGLVESALAVDYPGPPTGRVRDVPDQRAIRWYITRGLVDRPAATRGRVALYGRRHLLQLVAIKRRQAQGRSLSDIQAELAGATDAALAAVARLSPDVPMPHAPVEPAVEPASRRPVRFWADRQEPAAAVLAEPPAAWNARPQTVAGPQRRRAGAAERPVPDERDGRTDRAAAASIGPTDVVTLHAIRLAPGVTLLIEDGTGHAADPADVRAAARPMLDLLAAGKQAAESRRPNPVEE